MIDIGLLWFQVRFKPLPATHKLLGLCQVNILSAQWNRQYPYTWWVQHLLLQCPLDKATLDIAAALPLATSTPVTSLRQYLNIDLGHSDLKFYAWKYQFLLFSSKFPSEIATALPIATSTLLSEASCYIQYYNLMAAYRDGNFGSKENVEDDFDFP